MPFLTQATIDYLKAWDSTKAELARLKALEMEQRRMVVTLVFGNTAVYGTNHFDMGGGFDLEYVRSLNYKLDTSDADPRNNGATNTDRALDAIRALGNEGPFIADRLVKWTPELSVTEYKALSSDTIKKIIDKVITTKDEAPALTIKQKAAKG